MSSDDDLYGDFEETKEYGVAPSADLFPSSDPDLDFDFDNKPPPTSFRIAQGGPARPMTSNVGLGFSSAAPPRTAMGMTASGPGQKPMFDPLGGTGLSLNAPSSLELDPEAKLKQIEGQIRDLIDEGAECNATGDFMGGLNKAKEALKKEKFLVKQEDFYDLRDLHNVDVSALVHFNLANQYVLCGRLAEALNGYAQMLKNKTHPNIALIRVNMGNIYFTQEKYATAIKMYQMALDKLPSTCQQIRLRVLRNVANSHVKLGQFQDAVNCFENIMENQPDYKTGFNVLLCYYALGEREKMKIAFSSLIKIKSVDVDMEEDISTGDGEEEAEERSVFDDLKKETKERQRLTERYVLYSSKLIAPKVAKELGSGYDYIITSLRESPFAHIASELEIAKALAYVKDKEFEKAIEVLKSFEKKEASLVVSASTNLSFLHFLEGDIKSAEKYANIAVKTDRFNAKALVNKGNCAYARGAYEKAAQHYKEAAKTESDCVEAIYNLGLTFLKMENYDSAVRTFRILNKMMPNTPEVISILATLAEMKNEIPTAEMLLTRLVSLVPTDPSALARLGEVAKENGDEAQAFQCYSESYRYFPANMEVISWLGAYYVRAEAYEKALPFFRTASQLNKDEVKWRLMVASCYRRVGQYHAAVAEYKTIRREFPENLECLKYLVHLCNEVGAPAEEIQLYSQDLKKLERTLQQQRLAAGASPAVSNPPSARHTPEENDTLATSAKSALGATNSRGRSPAPQQTPPEPRPEKPEEEEWGDDVDDLLPD